MYYSQEIIDQVIDANNIVEVIGSYVSLTKKGSTYFGLCPFHSEKTPSFSVTDNGDRQMFYCFGCHTGGSVLTFLMKYENYSYTEAIKVLADRAGITLPQPDYSKEASEKQKKRDQVLEADKAAAIYFYHLLKSERGKNAYKYLKDRGLTDETIKNFGLGYSDKYRDDLYRHLKSKGFSDDIINESRLCTVKETDTHDTFWNRVMFPIMDTRNRVIAFGGRVMGEGEPKYLNSPENICFEKSRNLYGLNVARKHKGDFLILCEGYMDVITLHQAGFTNAVASLGTALTEGHAGILKRYTDKVLISYDADTAGRDAALRAIPRLKNAGINVKVVDLSPYKDPDELIKNAGAGEYTARLNNAVNGFFFETDALASRFDLKDPEEKSRFGNELADKLSNVEDDLERENYTQALCSKYDLNSDIISRKIKGLLLNKDGGFKVYKTDRREKPKKSSLPSGLETSQKMLLAYMAEDTSFYEKISDIIDESSFTTPPYDRIAEVMINQLRHGHFNPVGIISSFEDTEDQEKAADILNYDFEGISGDEKNKALSDCIINLELNRISLLINEEQDINRVIALKKQQEDIRKFSLEKIGN